MFSVNTLDDISRYMDGHLTVTKASYCSHAQFEVSISNDTCSAILERLVDPEFLIHSLSDDNFPLLSLRNDDDLGYVLQISFKSVDAYKACCTVLNVDSNADIIKNGRSIHPYDI